MCISASSATGRRWPGSEADVAARGLGDSFTFTGRVSDDLLLDMLNTADVCVNPDRATPMNDLSTMNKILEYMTLKKPIVQFDLKEGRASAGEASLYARRNDPVDFADKIDEAPRRPSAPGSAWAQSGGTGSRAASPGRIRRRCCSPPTSVPSRSGAGASVRRFSMSAGAVVTGRQVSPSTSAGSRGRCPGPRRPPRPRQPVYVARLSEGDRLRRDQMDKRPLAA